MADESIVGLIKPDFPKVSVDSNGTNTRIEYIGDTTTLESAKPWKGDTWGDYTGYVESTDIEPIGGTDYSTLIVNVLYRVAEGQDEDGQTQGDDTTVRFELEWAVFSRSLYEHPAFATGGGGLYALTEEDIAAIKAWESGNPDDRAAFKYIKDPAGTTAVDLSDNAKMFAKGLNLGQENWEDYAPVVRKTTTYLGGLPGESEAGMKDNPPSFLGGPAGYEWKKTADRAIQANEDFDWDRVEEWTGGKKILLDKENIYWGGE